MKMRIMLLILKEPFYGLISIAVTIAFAMLYYYTSLIDTINEIDKVISMVGLPYTIASITLPFIASILAGISVALMIYRIRGIARVTCSTAFGSALPVFTPGCPACTTPLTAILSTIGGLALLPLQGLELKIVSISALTFSIYWLLKKIELMRGVKR